MKGEKYYAISARSESGDDYLSLVKAKTPQEAAKIFADQMGEELGYIFHNDVAAEDHEDARAAHKALNRLIENAEIDI